MQGTPSRHQIPTVVADHHQVRLQLILVEDGEGHLVLLHSRVDGVTLAAAEDGVVLHQLLLQLLPLVAGAHLSCLHLRKELLQLECIHPVQL